MTEAAKKYRDELAKKYAEDSGDSTYTGIFKDGFDAGYAYQEERFELDRSVKIIEAMSRILVVRYLTTSEEQVYLAALAKIRGKK